MGTPSWDTKKRDSWALTVTHELPIRPVTGPAVNAASTVNLLELYEATATVVDDGLLLAAATQLPDALVRLCRIHLEELIEILREEISL